MVSRVVGVALAALVLSGCTATAQPVPTPSPSPSTYVPLQPATPTPVQTAQRYSRTVGPTPGLTLDCRPATQDERELLRHAGAIERPVVVEFGEPWRVMVFGMPGETEQRAVVMNGERYSGVDESWTGGYYALDVQLVDGPAARAAAEACYARG